jgi:hypothetical protein
MRGAIMTTAEKLYQVTQQLPEPMLAELLDFAEFLRQRKLPEGGQSGNLTLLDLQGGLEDSVAFADAPLSIQKKLRDEWN